MVPLVVATSGVAMDTLFCPDDHFSTPLTLRHQFPSSSTIDESNGLGPVPQSPIKLILD